MGYASLLVHTVDNNIDNIDILLTEKNLGTEGGVLVGKILKEQLNKILENAELYYLEDNQYARNKDIVFLLEYINYIFVTMIKRYQTSGKTYFIFPIVYKGKKVKTENELSKIQQLLQYLFATVADEMIEVQLDQIEEELYIELNLEKKQEHSLQTK